MYSTYLGGSSYDYGFDICVQINHGMLDKETTSKPYIVGYTYSDDFPLEGEFQSSKAGGADAFIARLHYGVSDLFFSSYIGGQSIDCGNGIAIYDYYTAFIAGDTESSDFPTVDPYQTDQPIGDAFVSKVVAEETPWECGDADASGGVDIDDVVYLINYIFSGGPEPIPYESGDADCSTGVDIDDVVYLINYIFSGGNAPCDTNGDGVPDC